MKKILLYLWQLPQNILGLIFLLCIRGEERHKLNDIHFYFSKTFPGGISLGQYIILGWHKDWHVRHEYGHCIQSKKWGWLYLPVVGLCSGIWALLYGWVINPDKVDYYSCWTEKNANKLGGV